MHRNLAWTTRAIAESWGLGRDMAVERFSGNLPLIYTYGKSVLLVTTYLAAPIVFTRHLLSPRVLLRLVEDVGITHLSLVPYLCGLLLTLPRFTQDALPQLRRITVAGGAPTEDIQAELIRRFPGRVIPMYGCTEASTRVTCMPAGEVGGPRSCGKPLAGVEPRIVDDHGQALPTGHVGEVLVRGPNVMQGYFRDPVATAAAMTGGWLHTGDMGALDDAGYLTISGRRKDVIKTLGESVSAFSVEAAIAKLEEVAKVAVIGIPDPRMGEAICAFVCPRGGAKLSADRVRRHCAETLGRARVPSHVQFLAELPKTASGKVRKHLLLLP